ncbi:MAG: response regulator [Lachnospiraceae bacterium]|nr:response regulator [Lachnospiraceae bacterium]
MKGTAKKQFLATIILVFVLQAFMLVYIFTSFYSSSEQDIKNLSESNTKSQATMIDNYLSKGSDVLWFAAESVDHMLGKGISSADLREYLVVTSARMKQQYDDNFTGIYGLLNGTYLDGAGWVPPNDFDPRTRDWYTEGKAAAGRMVMTHPYVDAQTGQIIISFTQLLSDGESVLSLDIVLDEVQKITEEMTMGDIGYGFIVDDTGLVIAHYDKNEIGKNYLDNTDMAGVVRAAKNNPGGSFPINIKGREATVFTEPIQGDWNVVIITDNDLLYRRVRTQLLVGIVVSLLIFAVIVFFCIFSLKKIARAEAREQESLHQLQSINMNIIRSLATTIDAKDRYTSGHSQRVADYSVRIAKKLGKSEDEQRVIFYAGLLHDVGKIRVSADVLNKPGRLTEEEFDQIRVHPASGYHILKDVNDDEDVGYGAKYHHERYDGTGYPNGLEGDSIPEVARIIAVADAYDAMASNRSYRKLLPQDVIREEIIRGKGSQFDPKVADAMIEIIDDDREYDLCQNDDDVKNILVIDDDKMVLSSVALIMEDIEYFRIMGAYNREEALEALKPGHISLIMLDLKMPDVDGFSLFTEIRETYDIPVIMMTGDKSEETVRKIRELGIDDYLTKPLNPAVTRETVHGILYRCDVE